MKITKICIQSNVGVLKLWLIQSIFVFVSSRKSLSPIKAPPPPEPEDNFLILEDDTPLWFSIPSKSATSKRPNRTPSNSKDNSDEKGAKDSPIETEQKQQEAEQASNKPGPTAPVGTRWNQTKQNRPDPTRYRICVFVEVLLRYCPNIKALCKVLCSEL